MAQIIETIVYWYHIAAFLGLAFSIYYYLNRKIVRIFVDGKEVGLARKLHVGIQRKTPGDIALQINETILNPEIQHFLGKSYEIKPFYPDPISF